MSRFWLAWFLLGPLMGAAQEPLKVGSKRFTESYILGEIIVQRLTAHDSSAAVHHRGMGNTGILVAALKSGAIDIYPEYTGTIVHELLQRSGNLDLDMLNRELAPQGIAAGIPLGFSNSYGLAMLEARAAALGVTTIGDLARHPGLSVGLSQEFLNRRDGWPALKEAYRLPFDGPRGLDHGLAYEALAAGQIDVTDVYTTDAKLGTFQLRVLADDRSFFPAYDAVLLYRTDLPARFPRLWEAVQTLEGRVSNRKMVALNAAVELAGVSFEEAARRFLSGTLEGDSAGKRHSRSVAELLFGHDLWRLTGEHLLLVFASLALSVAVGVPLGIWADRSVGARFWILPAVGVLQTVPSLALLAFLITLTGLIGTVPALAALFLYGLLPIVRNTLSGLGDVAPTLRESAEVLGLSRWAQLRDVHLPLASRSILGGIKTSAVINVGTATVAAFIGAGGYGDRIVAGLAVRDNAMLLAGAIPAALLALAIQSGFDLLDRWLIPQGLLASRERTH